MKNNKKIKFNSETTLEDISNEIQSLAYCAKTEIPLDHITKIVKFLNGEELPNKGGSSVRFRHEALLEYKYYTNGIFQIHTIHKGGKKMILKNNFKNFLLEPLSLIINELKINKNV